MLPVQEMRRRRGDAPYGHTQQLHVHIPRGLRLTKVSERLCWCEGTQRSSAERTVRVHSRMKARRRAGSVCSVPRSRCAGMHATVHFFEAALCRTGSLIATLHIVCNHTHLHIYLRTYLPACLHVCADPALDGGALAATTCSRAIGVEAAAAARAQGASGAPAPCRPLQVSLCRQAVAPKSLLWLQCFVRHVTDNVHRWVRGSHGRRPWLEIPA